VLKYLTCCRLKGAEGKGREGKGREGKGREGKGREGKGSLGPSLDHLKLPCFDHSTAMSFILLTEQLPDGCCNGLTL